MNIDVIERLTALSPAPPFAADDRRAMVDAIMTAHHTPHSAVIHRPARRRRVLLGATVAGVALAAVVVPALLPSSAPGSATPAAAAELHRLAGITAAGAPLEPGQFRYQREISTQTGVFPDADHQRPAVTVTNRSQFWTDAAGDVWGVTDDLASDGQLHHEVVYAPGNAGMGDVNKLPTDALALNSYLRAHQSGSSSVDEAVFSAVTNILGGGNASPALRSAAVDVLAMTGHVTVTRDAQDSRGRRVERFDFVDAVHRPDEVQSYSFDPESGQILDSADTHPGSHFVSTVAQTTVVGAVPADVVSAAKAQYATTQQLIVPGSGG